MGHADNIDGPEKECDVLRNQGSERHGGPQVKGGFLGGLGKHTEPGEKEQDIEKEKRGSLPGSPVHGILQARIRNWVAVHSSRGSS